MLVYRWKENFFHFMKIVAIDLHDGWKNDDYELLEYIIVFSFKLLDVSKSCDDFSSSAPKRSKKLYNSFKMVKLNVWKIAKKTQNISYSLDKLYTNVSLKNPKVRGTFKCEIL